MKNVLFSLVLLMSISSFGLLAQESFQYDMKGLSPEYVVMNMADMSQETLFNKATTWAKSQGYSIQDSKSPAKFTLVGEKANALCFTVRNKTSCNNLRFTVEVAFKENKYKFEVKGLEQYGPINDTGKKGWFPVALDKAPDAFYTRGGELKKEYVDTPGNISGLFNDLNKKLKEGLLKKAAEKEDDGW